MNLEQSYQQKAQEYGRQVQSLRSRGRGFVVGEVVLFVAFVASLAVITQAEWRVAGAGLAVVFFVGYVVLRRLDVRNDTRARHLEDLQAVYGHEVLAQRGDYHAFDEGTRYADPHHAFSYDLDIFGPDSMYQRICRTVTTGGSDALARHLSELQPLSASPDNIDRLAADEPFRMAFIARGARGKIDTDDIARSLESVRQLSVASFFSSPWVLAAVWVDVAAFLACVVLAAVGKVSAMLPLWWGTLQFFAAYALCNVTLRRIGSALGHLQDQLRQLMEVVTLLSPEPVDSFQQLATLLDDLDKRGNILGLLLTDALCLNDMRVVRRFVRWRGKGADDVEAWVGRVVRKDVEVTVATLRYNHPQTTWPQWVPGSTLVYEAHGLWHPFLGARAMRNDFRIDDRNFYIVTGANMAGKSTFLRAIGVNYVLAMAGMPVFAELLMVSRFKLFSSMRTTDDLSHGISYFNAELLRLKQLIAFCDQEILDEEAHPLPTLLILDEILKGTNSADKLSGSRMFLEAVSRKKVAGIIATHDLKLSEMADRYPEQFHNCCFEIGLGERVTYSYKVTPGVARNQNATYLLRQILG